MEPQRTAPSSRRRLSREDSQAQTRDRLIETATRLFAAQGYGGTSIRDIAEQAGYSQGAFYSNFGSKESLLLDMLRRHMAAETEQLARLITPDGRTPEAVLDGLQTWATTLDQDIDWSMLSIELQLQAQRSPSFAISYREVWQRHCEALAHWIGQLFSAYQLQPPVPADALAATLMALVHGLALQRAATGNDIPRSMIIVMLRGMIAMARAGSEPGVAAGSRDA